MNIPNDTGGDWRLQKAVEFIGNLPDVVTPLAVEYLKSKNAKKNGVVWFIFLYCCCYNVPTACFLYENLDYRTVNISETEKFWEQNKTKLIFQSDRRYVKSRDKFPTMTRNFILKSRREPWKYLIKREISENDSQRTFKNLCWVVSNFHFFGQFSIMLFLELLNKLLRVDFEGTEFNFSIGSYTTSAIQNILQEDGIADYFDLHRNFRILGDYQYKDLETKYYDVLKRVVFELREKYPSKKWNMANVIHGLASYRKLYKGTRYLGYYVDRQQEELLKMRQNYPNYDNLWNLLDDARMSKIPHKYLGELNDWEGIQENKCKLWLEEGRF